mgnify:CR=1 FL=1
MPPLILTFLKAPRPGAVKTRLGKQIGLTEAALIYRQLAEAQLSRIPADFRTEIHYAPRGSAGEMRTWLGAQRIYRVQSGGDLGARLNKAFTEGFRRGYRRIIAIGSDCPQLDEACLRRAVDNLNDTDVVLGPATDGGYYLIGLRRPAPRLFEGIEWSTSSVLAATRVRIHEGGLSSALLDEKDDIDDLASLQRHQGATQGLMSFTLGKSLQ